MDNLAHTLMFQGTASHVGKTTLVAGMCRLLANMGYSVAPFKAQNMSLNSYVTADGFEIARAQALQAFAAGVPPSVDMNPILLKPKGNCVSQIVLRGKPYMDVKAGSYYDEFALKLGLSVVRESLESLLEKFDVVIIEGAGSAAEPNLYDRDIANMRVAKLARSPVLLVADIDLGGAFASLLGTLDILSAEDNAMVKGFILNKFRGELSLLEPALKFLKKKTGRPVVGVIPHLGDLRLPSEDSVSIGSLNLSGSVDVAVIRLPSISNFTDVESLALNPDARIRYVSQVDNLGQPDLIIIPGSKNTVSDTEWLRSTGLARAIKDYAAKGAGWVVGICGGYEILGKRIVDPYAIEGDSPGEHEALGLLDAVTVFRKYEKVTRLVEFRLGDRLPTILRGLEGELFEGYEIRMGEVILGEGAQPLLKVRPKGSLGAHWEAAGACSKDFRVLGTSVHGFFDNPTLTARVLSALKKSRPQSAPVRPQDVWESELNKVAKAIRENMDLNYVFRIMGLHEHARKIPA
ncbi:MAG: cobyric acid synthase [Thermoprotei archaeon]